MVLLKLISLGLTVLLYARGQIDFFGTENQYKCHCTNGCDSSLNCIGDSNECDKEWFGFGCQYQNLAHLFISNVYPDGVMPLFNGSVHGDCELMRHIPTLLILIKWNISMLFSWMRFKVTNEVMLDTLNFGFIDVNRTYISCINQKLLQVNENTFDLHCDLHTTFEEMYIEGEIVKSLCLIQINGGRNLALLQKTSQSTQHEDFEAKYAVDGVISEVCHDTCSHTHEDDPHPSWTVTFDHPYNITRFVIYNRFDAAPDRLKKFNLEAFNSEGHAIFKVQDKNNTTQQVYYVFHPYVEPVYGVKISQRHKYYKDRAPILTINEFEAFGECVDGTWGLGCNNVCNTSCTYSCNKDDGTCNAVCVPNTNPPRCLTENHSTQPHFSILSLVSIIAVIV